ncbi:MAG: hypothetical protein CFE43_12730 [Burkholderiales bacterium PBB3]|nr:MAG: hypothetical protein CFE43_12730 [Burkholderiales bacterium PBB3]
MKTPSTGGGTQFLVFGPSWIVMLFSAGFIGLVGLLFTASVAAEHSVSDAIAPTMAGVVVSFMAALTWLTVSRLADTQQRFAARLAPSRSLVRAGRVTVLALLLVWVVCTLPTALLFSVLQQNQEAFALVCGTGLMLTLTAAAACAWQGRRPWWAALPAVVVVGAMFTLGYPAVGAGWVGIYWGWQVLALGLSLVLHAPMLRGSAHALHSPARRFARWSESWLASWRMRYQSLRAPGDVGNFPFLIILASQSQMWRWIGWEQEGVGMPGVLLGILLGGAYHYLVSSDLHPRHLIAPGRARRAHMALRIVGSTLRMTLSVGLMLAAILLLAIAAWGGGLSATLHAGAASIIAVLVPMWVLAVVAATWLRSLEGPRWLPWVAGLGVLVLTWLALMGLTRWVGLNQGQAMVCVTLVGCTLLLPLAQRAWKQKDLSQFRR